MTKAINLAIDKDTWRKFKELTPRTYTLNGKVVELIEKYIKEKDV